MKECVCRFIVTSDVHYEADRPTEHERFEKGMKMAYDYAAAQPYKKIDAFIADGDFANSGSGEQMTRFKQSLDKCIPPETVRIMTLASHEFFHDGPEGAYRRFGEIFGLAPDSHTVINGFHFIGVSCSERCLYKDDKLAFFAEELKKAAADDRKKPIFVFQHPHPQMTVYGSSAWGEDSFVPILMNYPQVIDFSGHSHAPVNDPRSVHQKHFTSFGTGSFSYFELDEFDTANGTVPPDAHTCAQFLIVEVFDDNSVKVIPVDVISGKFFCDGITVEKPWDPDSFVYTDDRADTEPVPEFAADARIRVEKKENGIAVTFPQALMKDARVNTYTVTVKDAQGFIRAKKKIFSSYYLYDMPASLTVGFDLTDGGEYTAQVVANGFWKVRSLPLTGKFTL